MALTMTSTSAVGSVTSALAHGPLGRAGGVTVVDDVPTPGVVAALTREALAQGSIADRQCGETRIVDDGRGDVPGRSLGSGPGGPAQDALYASAGLRAMLSELCGVDVRPTGGRGSYSYYTRPGDHLDLHVDIEACDVTVITVLHDSTPVGDLGGALVAYPERFATPLSLVRADPGRSAVVKAPTGSSVVILGGLVPHRIHPLDQGTRVISVMCFEAIV